MYQVLLVCYDNLWEFKWTYASMCVCVSENVWLVSLYTPDRRYISTTDKKLCLEQLNLKGCMMDEEIPGEEKK